STPAGDTRVHLLKGFTITLRECDDRVGALMTTYDVTKHVIHTRADGVPHGTTPDQVAAPARAAASADRVVIPFHGGLVSPERGFETAERLAAEYQRAAAYPVF